MQNEKMKNLVSIGLPTYNRPDALRRALKIITEQTYRNLEIIISDNASPDTKSKEVIEEFAFKDSRIKHYRQQENIGVLANAEFVLQQAQGEYFTWISDDDWRSPEFIELLVEELEKNTGVDFAFCDYREVYENGSSAEGYPSSHLNVFKPFTSRSRIIRVANYYWQDATYGKPNIFYSVFRREILAALDIKKITNGYKLLNMDCLVAFKLLQKSPAYIRSEMMCTLTCGNQKYYINNTKTNSSTNLSNLLKLVNLFKEGLNDRNLYMINTNSLAEKIIIYSIYFPKILARIKFIGINKLKNKLISFKSIKNKNNNFNNGVKLKEIDNSRQKLQLPNVTLVAMATRNVEETLQALDYSCKGIKFGAVKLLSHYTPHGLHENIEFIRINKIKNIDEWSYKIIYELSQYIDTEFALLVHADGFVVNPSSWKNDFLNYDYIGAPWPLPKDNFSYRDVHGNIVRVGNSVSLRSKKLLELPIKLNLPWEPYHGYYNEDGFICVKNKHIYEAEGIKFATLDMAKYFSHEAMIPEISNIKPFVFHKWAGSNRIYPKF